MMNVKRGDIFYADLSPVVGSEQGGLRPVLIIQNDIGNRYSPTVIAAAITSRMGKTRLPTHIDVYAGRVGLSKDSVILLEQVRTLDKRRLKEKMGHLDGDVMQSVNNAIAVSFGLEEGDRTYVGAGTVATPPAAAVATTATATATAPDMRPDGRVSVGLSSIAAVKSATAQVPYGLPYPPTPQPPIDPGLIPHPRVTEPPTDLPAPPRTEPPTIPIPGETPPPIQAATATG